MSAEYHHGLAADWRARHAMSTASKVGGAYSGYRPRESRGISPWWLFLVGLALVIVAKRMGL